MSDPHDFTVVGVALFTRRVDSGSELWESWFQHRGREPQTKGITVNYGSPSTAHAPAHGGYPGTVSAPLLTGVSPEPSGTTAKVAQIPDCSFCSQPATVDGKTHRGPWAFMCEDHYQANGVGLGLGRGQRLVLR